jgi:hypothetical protein
MKAQRGNGGTHWRKMKVDGQCYAPAALPPGKRPVTHYTGSYVGTRASLDRCVQSRPTGTRSPDHRVRNESLYRLRYPGPPFQHITSVFMLISFVRGNINADIKTYIRKMLGTLLPSSVRRAANQRNSTTLSHTRLTTDDAKSRLHESG